MHNIYKNMSYLSVIGLALSCFIYQIINKIWYWYGKLILFRIFSFFFINCIYFTKNIIFLYQWTSGNYHSAINSSYQGSYILLHLRKFSMESIVTRFIIIGYIITLYYFVICWYIFINVIYYKYKTMYFISI